MTLQVALEALHRDAAMWDRVSHTTDQAHAVAADLILGIAELSWASRAAGLESAYTEIQTKISSLLGDATRVYSGLSTTLDQVAAAYEADDDQAAATFRGLWEENDD